MRLTRELGAWTLAGAVGALLLCWAYPRAAPFSPPWRISDRQAEAIALARLRDLGPPVARPYVVTRLSHQLVLDRRLQLTLDAAGDRQLARLRQTGLPDRILAWEVLVYPPEALRDDWAYRAEISTTGRVIALQQGVESTVKGTALDRRQARARADAFLRTQGIDPARYGEPELRAQQLAGRTDLALRYPDRTAFPGLAVSYGVAVTFAGQRLTGFSSWVEDPQERALKRSMQPLIFVDFGEIVVLYLLILLLAGPFLRRYHAGEIGVARAGQLFVLVAGAGLALVLLVKRALSSTMGIHFASVQQITWLFTMIFVIFNVLPAALLAFFAWSVGEAVCRERWGAKLAAFDALLQRKWSNATVARSSLVGLAAGALFAGAAAGLFAALRGIHVWGQFGGAGNFASGWRGAELAGAFVTFALPCFLTVLLWVLPSAARRLGRALGLLAALVVWIVVLPGPVLTQPLGWGIAAAALLAAGPILLFLAYDLLAALIAGYVSYVLFLGYPLLSAASGSLRIQGWLALAVGALPLAVSLRELGGRREFSYRYEDVPPHVRRIAERERQRVELETARGIQSSILPDLPPRLAGVDVAHAYLPATEVGGDFYDLMALEDGRLAMAVGDVAGHGVSSGLVMSMAKSALAVQVTWNPEVEAVFRTLNRTVYQAARKRLLTTFCYALLDPRRRELLYASAGHLYPYRITSSGKVEALISTGYPLGVRQTIAIDPHLVRLAPGDALFLFSDGLIEARPERSDEQFGFDRLEQSLARHAGASVESLRDGVLADVSRFTANAPREDDQTILVLRLPAA
ncbi:MAG TPA: PP2C family protein-serine/threonine phosphatase [Thermoanaerobaculia bacterium]|nr:PP2C family protein-serine/threonine phosphatase [Thermoanaerobaculia bacterium]